MENKEKKENEWPDEMRSAIQVALTKIKADPEASMVLRELKDLRFDEGRLAKIVYFYCGGTERRAQRGLRAMLKFADDLENMGRQLIEDADRLDRIINKLEQGGTGVLRLEMRIIIPGLQDVGLPALMLEFADSLSAVARSYKTGLRNIRLGGKRKRGAISRVNISAGRTQWLLYLAYLISGGKGPGIDHYRQIARLVAAVRGDRNPVYETIAATLERAARRFQEQDLVRALTLASAAQEELDSLPSAS